MELFDGFSWAVPRALSGAVAACRFEQGDVLYSDPCGYERWPLGARKLRYQLQVLFPPKSARAVATGQDGGRFSANWLSPVEFELTQREDGTCTRLVSTQGRLYTCLWRGSTDYLDQGQPDPPEPGGQRELHGRLAGAKEIFERHFAKQWQEPFSVYLSAVDESSDAARLKASTVAAELREHFGELAVQVLSPVQAGLDPEGELRPALSLVGVSVANRGLEAIEACLCNALYGGIGDSTRFSVSRHGLLWGPVSH